jgi:hypothetical protein
VQAATIGADVTTAAYKDGTMAADTQLTAGTLIYRAQKVYQLPDGGVVSATGQWSKCYAAIDWLVKGRKGEAPSFKDCQLLIVKKGGSVWLADDYFPEYPVQDAYIAIGCGAQAAMVAMASGASSIEAVQQVAKLDANTSGPVQYLSIKKKQQ